MDSCCGSTTTERQGGAATAAFGASATVAAPETATGTAVNAVHYAANSPAEDPANPTDSTRPIS